MSQEILATRVANALFADVRATGAVGRRIGTPTSLGIERVRKASGGLWVGGRVTLTRTTVEFRANGMNRAVHVGQVDAVVPLATVREVRIRRGFVTKIVEVDAGADTLVFRCYGARPLARLVAETAIAAQRDAG